MPEQIADAADLADSPDPDRPAEASSHAKPNPRLGWPGRLLIGLLVLASIAACVGWIIYESMQQEPDFYASAIHRPVAQLEEEGDRFETKVVDLQNQARQEGDWSFVFHEDEVNGWLAVDFPEKFPELQSRFVANPRIQIRESECELVFRYQSPRLSALISIVGDVFVVESTGAVAIRIKAARTGLVPIPISEVANQVTRQLRRKGLEISWAEVEGDPTAMISLNRDQLKLDGRMVRIEAIECKGEQVAIAGTTIDPDESEIDSSTLRLSEKNSGSDSQRRAHLNRSP